VANMLRYTVQSVKETPSRGITVTSSLNENEKGGGTRRRKALLRPPPSLYTEYQASGRIHEDDVNRSSSASDTCFIMEPHSI
jgi:hypothetical protein